MSTVVTTIKIGSRFDRMAAMTVPGMRTYAERIGADFHIIDRLTSVVGTREYAAYWAKFQLADLLERYDRVIYLDLDAVVLPHCPDLRDAVSGVGLAALFEDDYGIDLGHEIVEIQARQGNIGWTTGYFNVGVMVLSRDALPAFRLGPGDIGRVLYPEQTQLNYNMQRLGIGMARLDHRYNHMHFLRLPREVHDARFASCIMHFAGIPQPVREIIIAEDLQRFAEGRNPLSQDELRDILHARFEPAEIKRMRTYSLMTNQMLGLAEAAYAD